MHNTSADKERLLQWFGNHTEDETLRKFYGAYMAPIFVQAYFAVTQAHLSGLPTMQHGMFFQNFTKEREFNWMWNVREMQSVREQLFASLESDHSFGTQLYQQYMEKFAAFDAAARELERVDHTELSNEDLVEKLLHIIHTAGGQCIGYTVDSLLSFSDDDWFAAYAEQYLGRALTQDELTVLREPTRRSFVNSFQLHLLEAATKKQTGETIDELVDEIVREYYWIENNYLRGTPKDASAIHAQIDETDDAAQAYEKETHRIVEGKQAKDALLKKLQASELLHAFVAMADDCVYIQDCRKQAVLRLNHFLFLYLHELAKRLDIDPDLIMYIMFFELKDLLTDPASVLALAKERKDGCLVLFDAEGCAIVTRQELEGIDVSPYFKDYSDVTEVKGTPACAGVVQAKARVVMGSDQFDQFEEGEILITNQTTPDFVPLMKKASAIIAEQGGVTSHAAIVSRELGIPCVVGVKDAMEIFYDGELIEVDAEQGIVKKL